MWLMNKLLNVEYKKKVIVRLARGRRLLVTVVVVWQGTDITIEL
jgi:hypothetical protein